MATSEEQFQTFLTEKSLKFTHERTLIFEHVMSTNGHFDAEMIFNGIKSQNKRISRDTVFRSLPLLLEAGLIQKSVGEGKGEYYEVLCPRDGHHDHMICIACHKVIEFYSKKLEEAQVQACNQQKFELIHHDHRLYGYCQSCVQP